MEDREKFAEDVVNRANTQAELYAETEVLVLNALVFFELIDDGLHILIE